MKKLLSLVMAILMAVSLFAVGVAAVDVGGSSSADVYIKIGGKVTNQYSIDITFGDMVFLYGANAEWDSEIHDYVVSPEAEWSPQTEGGDLITITNHSDLPITYETTFDDISNAYGDIKLMATEATGSIDKCPAKATTAPSDEVRVSLEGLPTSLTDEKVTLAKVIVTIRAVT